MRTPATIPTGDPKPSSSRPASRGRGRTYTPQNDLKISRTVRTYQHEKNTYQHEKNTYQHVDQRSGLETPKRYAKKHVGTQKNTGRDTKKQVFCVSFWQVSSPEMLHISLAKLTLSLAKSRHRPGPGQAQSSHSTPLHSTPLRFDPIAACNSFYN